MRRIMAVKATLAWSKPQLLPVHCSWGVINLPTCATAVATTRLTLDKTGQLQQHSKGQGVSDVVVALRTDWVAVTVIWRYYSGVVIKATAIAYGNAAFRSVAGEPRPRMLCHAGTGC